MTVAIVTGSGGLIGAETVKLFAARGLEVVGIDNDMRRFFFGEDASTKWQSTLLQRSIRSYTRADKDIRDAEAIDAIFATYGKDIGVVVHCAAQPSHDWAARAPLVDFTVNANGTLVMLEAMRKHCPEAVFILASTNKVYGDRPNELPLIELETRYELPPESAWGAHGIDESMSIDGTRHSLFGASKLAADVLTQEYGRYFGMMTGCFRAGCLTGSGHSAAQLHGFLAYLVKCAITGEPYTVLGYKGKQVRDNLHSADLAEAFWCFFRRPAAGEVFNIGGGRLSNCSILEAIALAEELAGRAIVHSYDPTNRIGDHIWWISDTRKFQSRYPEWQRRYDLRSIMEDIVSGLGDRLSARLIDGRGQS